MLKQAKRRRISYATAMTPCSPKQTLSSSPVDMSSATTIDDLNDDVLRAIFTHLSASELCVVADVCSAFTRNAQAEFSSRYKMVDFLVGREQEYRQYKNPLHLRQLAPALRNFGQSIVSIGISLERHEQSSQAVKFITQYCGASLKEMALENIKFTFGMILKLQPLLSRLGALKLYDCKWESNRDASTMLSFCPELHTLECRGECLHNARVTFPKLSSLSIRYDFDISDQSINYLLAVNPPLREINIIGCQHSNTSRIIQSIVQHTPGVEKISLLINSENKSDFIESAKQFKRLTALKSLNIGCFDESFSPVLNELAAAHIPLEHLHLFDLLPDAQLLNEMAKWSQLREFGLEFVRNLPIGNVLRIVCGLSELTKLSLIDVGLCKTDLIKIVRCAPKLRKLEFSLWREFVLKFEVDLFMRIRNVVAKRKDKSPGLLILIEKENSKLNVPKELQIANEKFLKVECVSFDKF